MMVYKSIFLGFLSMLLLQGCAGHKGKKSKIPKNLTTETYPKDFDKALAPPVSTDHLGRPYNAQFEQVGDTLFPGADYITIPIDEMSSTAFVIEDTFSLSINAKVWKIGGEIGGGTSNRYATYRAYQITEVIELDDTQKPKKAPAEAVFYLWRIYKGHMYEMLFEGTETTFNAQVKADFKIAEGGINSIYKDSQLDHRVFARGLVPTQGDSIFCEPQDVKKCYTTEGAAEAPIFDQYRLIPGRTAPPEEIIEFTKPFQKAGKYHIEVKKAAIRFSNFKGNSWDALGGHPDPFVSVFLNEVTPENHLFTTPTMSDTHWPNWDYSEIHDLGPQDKLNLIIFDRDITAHDTIGRCETKPLGEMDGNNIVFDDCGQAEELLLVIY